MGIIRKSYQLIILLSILLKMKKILLIPLLLFLFSSWVNAWLEINESNILKIDWNLCVNTQEKDVPTILIPWILASWYSEEWYNESNVKRWIPDPINHTYDTLIYTFKQKWYQIKDVFYKDKFTLNINWSNPKWWLYVFWYDWKNDNKITATLLTQLVWLILRDYEKQNWCNIWKVNIVAHSMWGLVARSMLEDMCVKYDLKESWKFEINWYFDDSKYFANWKLQEFLSYPCQNPYPSNTISKEIKVNKLVTIATPHRWSTKAFSIWERWDLEMTDGFLVWIWIKGQIWVMSDLWLYKVIHWYDTKVPNWIVTLWQLLPDIKVNNFYNIYNNNLKYLYKVKNEDDSNYDVRKDLSQFYYDYDYPALDNLKEMSSFKDINFVNYPKNSFLEELNKSENIKKMFKKIDNSYVSYYSTITWTDWLNNIISYGIWDKAYQGWWFLWVPIDTNVVEDTTMSHTWQDIYDYYSKDIWKDYYLINKVIRNQLWLWWDWTVPTYNLKLVPNDINDWKEIQDDKFKSIEIDCSDKVYEWFWIDNVNEWCSHTNMPFLTSVKAVDFLLWQNTTSISERKQLLSNFWLATYLSSYYRIKGEGYQNIYLWIKNDALLWNCFLDESEVSDTDFDSEYYGDNQTNISKSNYIKLIDKDKIESDYILPISFSLKIWSGNWFIDNTKEMVDSISMYDIQSPIDIMITDDQWRRIWIDRDTWMIINEIPWAWTSWRSWESWEREIFMIPTKKWENINHKIVTNSTWDGEYHIVMSNFDYNWNTVNSWVTIEWNAKLWFNEVYNVVSTSSWSSYSELNKNLPLTLDVTKNIKTFKDNLDVRYNIYWLWRDNVVNINYNLFLKNVSWQKELISTSKEDIDWIVNVPIKESGLYELSLELLDINSNVLKTEIIQIEKEKQVNKNAYTEKFLDVKFYKNLDLFFYKDSSGWVDTNLNFKIDVYNDKQDIKINRKNWKIIDFYLDKDLKYKSQDNDNIELLEINSNYIVFKDSIEWVEKKYTYNLLTNRIEKLDLINWKNIDYFLISYDLDSKIKEIKSDNNILKFVYNGLILSNITDSYENIIEFSYDDNIILKAEVNGNLVEMKDDKRIDLVLQSSFYIKYNNKLNSLWKRLKDLNLESSEIQKLLNILNKSKLRYIKSVKNNEQKKEIEYLFEKISKILENLN